MKKQFSAVAVATAMLVGTGVANAQSGTGTASLAGNVAGYCDLSVVASGNGASFDVNDVLYDFGTVGFSLEISCNDIDGATLTGNSNNGGLQLDDDASVVIPYNVSVSGFTNGSMDFSSSTTGSKSEPGSSTLAGFMTLTATLSSTGTYAEWAGSYDDTLVFSIAANI